MNTKESIHAAATQNRLELQQQINLHKIVPIDRSIYSKTKKEKNLLWKLKGQWNVRIANGYKPETYSLAG